MSRTSTVYGVLIASPSDVQKERLTVQEVIHAWNAAHSAETSAVLLPIMWETHSTPSLSDRPQAIINKQIVAEADILVGIFWTRLGTPTGKAESGSVEEIKEFVDKGKPVLLYFSSVPVVPDSVDAEQYRRLKEFKEAIRDRGLVYDFPTPLELREALYRHLHKTVRDLQKQGQGESSTPTKTTGPPASQIVSGLAQEYESLVRRLQLDWASERDSGTFRIDKGQEILERARRRLLDFRTDPRVEENVELAGKLEQILREIGALELHQLQIDGGRSFQQFWNAGNSIVRELAEGQQLIGLTEERMAPLRDAADEAIGWALSSNAEGRTYAVVGATILRKKQEDRWTSEEILALRAALWSVVSDRRVNVGTASDAVIAESKDPDADVFIRVAFTPAGVVTFVFGRRGDPFPVGSAIAALLAGVKMLLHGKFQEVYAPIAPMEVTLGVVNWPEHGFSADLWSIDKPHPIGTLKGRGLHRTFSLSPNALPWTIVGPFIAYLLGDAGFVDYERYLDQPPPYAALVSYLEGTGLSLTG